MTASRMLVVVGFGAVLGCATGSGPSIGPDADPNDPNAPDANGLPNEQADASNGCDKQPCDTLPQCGCDTGQACDLDGADLPNGATACRNIIKAGQEDGNCNSLSGCDAGFICLGSPGQCRRYCDVDADCRTDEFCLIDVTYDAGGGTFMPVPGASTCTKACAPDAQSSNGCPASPQLACRVFRDDPDMIADNGDEYFLTDCATAGVGGQDADCTTNGSADCGVGFACVIIGAQNLCKQTCVVGGAATCTVGSCVSFTTPQTIGGIEYGLCN